MPEIANLLPSLIEFRRDIHTFPELGFQEHRTAAKIVETLIAAGIETHQGIGGTGIVGVLRSGKSKKSIGLRADMDALPIQEETGLPWASQNNGCHHGCGHDGHVAMLLGAALYFAKSKDFSGTINFIFQPAEEGQGGAKKMIEDGLFEKFPCDRIYAIHNWPTLAAGVISTRPGPIMGAADKFQIIINGKGGHAALPHSTNDSVLAAASMVQQLNTIISRNIPGSANAILSITEISGGHTHNVIPEQVRLGGTVRTFDPIIQDKIEERIRNIISGIEHSFEVSAKLHYDRYYPATINDDKIANEVLEIAKNVGTCELAAEPATTSEDFSFMLQKCPGAYIWLGQGKDSQKSFALHNPKYDFNDDIIETGINLHIALARNWLS